MFRAIVAAALLFVGGVFTVTAAAKEASYRLPSDSAFILDVNLQAVSKSQVGGMLLDMAVEKAIVEIAEKGNTDPTEAMRNVERILGFNPLEEIKSFAVSAADYKAPEDSLIAVVQLGKTTGNLEGLLLGLPNYQVAEYEGRQIHSAEPEDGQTFYVAFIADDDGDRRIVLSAQREAVAMALDQAAGKSVANDDADFIVEQSDDRLASLKVMKFPPDALEEGPPANIAKMIKNASIDVSEANGELDVRLALNTDNQQQAEQLRQMAEGLIAVVQFAQTADPDDANLKEISGLMDGATVTKDDTTVTLSVRIPAASVTALVNEKLKNAWSTRN